MGRTRIKICGIKTPEAAAAAVDAGADAVGFVFVTSSPRYIHPEDAYELMAALPPFVASVGVFMNPTLDEFSDAEELCPTLLTQLHGSEEPKLVRQVGPDVIKALAFDPDTLPDHLLRYADLDEVSALLIDATTPGQGVPFAWDKLPPLLDNVTKPVILAGGLTPDNVEAAIRAIRPYGVDVSSGVERERGVKDPGLIEAFCEAVRRADANS